MHLASPIEQAVAASVTALGFEMLSCTVFSFRNNTALRILIDHPAGVKISDCERVSRQISATLNVEQPSAAQYTLEISSPGLDRPLITLAHYQRFIGHPVHIRLYEALDGRKNFSGKLLNAANDQIDIEVDGQSLALPLKNIEKANLIPEVRF